MKDIFEMVFPGLMLMWVCFIANGVFMDIFKEYKTHTMSRLMASGVTLGEILLSKVLRCLVICWICELLLILFTGLVFDIGWKNPLGLCTVLTSFNLFLLGLLALIYGYAKSQEVAHGIVILVFLTSSMLGGSFIPFNQLPVTLQRIGYWTMIQMGQYGIESTFQARGPWAIVRPSLYLTGLGLVFIALGVRVLRKRFETGQAA
ncbi:MAG: ABC transporter permease [Phycisphaerae bacterium]|nr:ABC transporter permease [Phycisphaerae bacterium]